MTGKRSADPDADDRDSSGSSSNSSSSSSEEVTTSASTSAGTSSSSLLGPDLILASLLPSNLIGAANALRNGTGSSLVSSLNNPQPQPLPQSQFIQQLSNSNSHQAPPQAPPQDQSASAQLRRASLAATSLFDASTMLQLQQLSNNSGSNISSLSSSLPGGYNSLQSVLPPTQPASASTLPSSLLDLLRTPGGGSTSLPALSQTPISAPLRLSPPQVTLPGSTSSIQRPSLSLLEQLAAAVRASQGQGQQQQGQGFNNSSNNHTQNSLQGFSNSSSHNRNSLQSPPTQSAAQSVSALALSNERLLQQLSSTLTTLRNSNTNNPPSSSLPPFAAAAAPQVQVNSSQGHSSQGNSTQGASHSTLHLIIQRLTQENNVKDQIISLLMAELQKAQNANSSSNGGSANSDNNRAASSSSSSSNHMDMETANGSNSASVSNGGPLQNQSLAHQGQVQGNGQGSTTSELKSPPEETTAASLSSSTTINGNGGVLDAMLPLGGQQSRNKTEERWMVRYLELKQFQKKYGHCRVPHGYVENPKLSWWVMNQRSQYTLLKQGKKHWLADDRLALLDAIKFEWKAAVGKRKK